VSWENLYEAARRAALGKRKRPDVAAFLLQLEPEIVLLRRELTQGCYVPGPYREFTVEEPKRRVISAAPFRDRVVHHAVTQILEPVFERRFTADSFACRAGLGTHRALARARAGCDKFPYVLKCDIRRYFPSIDHETLAALLARAVKCRPTLDLAGRIIAGFHGAPEPAVYYPGDDLFTPLERSLGLPLGNQTSQLFANVYLNPLDHFVARELQPGCYVRYVDDFLLFGESKAEVAEWRCEIVEFLCRLRLRMHEGKSRLYRTGDGITFLGWRLFPGRSRLVRGNVVRARRRFRDALRDYHAGKLDLEACRCRIMSWLGHARHGQTYRIRQSVLDHAIFVPAVHHRHCPAGRFLEQQSKERPRFEP
jgi:retron-type reverse transcriptase